MDRGCNWEELGEKCEYDHNPLYDTLKELTQLNNKQMKPK